MTDPIARLNAALQDRYVLERELGEGGMATVYLAEIETTANLTRLGVAPPSRPAGQSPPGQAVGSGLHTPL